MKRKVMTILCFITGFLLCSYPLVSNRIEQERQQKVITTYENGLEKTKDMESVWREAQKYNEMLQQIHGKIVAGMMEKTLREEHYETLLNVSKTGVMGVIVIPKISVKLPIYHGTGEDVLAVGAGHMEGSALPVGGENTRCVITGHRGLPNSKLFTRLDELKKEDLFFLDVCGRTLAYEVSKIEVIEPEITEVLEPEKGEDLVSLITCTPYGLNTHRLVVTGKRVPYRESERKNLPKKVPSIRELFFDGLPAAFLVSVFVPKKRNRRKRCLRQRK